MLSLTGSLSCISEMTGNQSSVPKVQKETLYVLMKWVCYWYIIMVATLLRFLSVKYTLLSCRNPYSIHELDPGVASLVPLSLANSGNQQASMQYAKK
jgi:hypothetical protein